ncbi:hydrogenase maturation protease [Beggiatoa leptomitoformis]|uniref:Hydrogenase maturation protease n=2 Tax=Beggiatoa leptomitoformis TaxID=288004 RepID=A0A2N9YAH6_9GAMM|nr:hydrogenase maturation protease [Beggiatoa leptomitoformis]AUI67461.1 hydrogenase maturation protease [Beggiatoa leptomitoformis]
MQTLVLGIGNSLLSDEGIGIHVLNYLQTQATSASVEYIDGGTLSFSLAPLIEDAQQLIVIDAAQLHAPVGTIHYFINEEMERFLNKRQSSAHEVSLIDLLTVASLTERLPKRRALVAVQPKKLDWGMIPSPELASAIPQIAALVIQLIEAWSISETALAD